MTTGELGAIGLASTPTRGFGSSAGGCGRLRFTGEGAVTSIRDGSGGALERGSLDAGGVLAGAVALFGSSDGLGFAAAEATAPGTSGATGAGDG